MWDFVKTHKVLIASSIIPIALIVRFPGVLGILVRIGISISITVLQRMPPHVAYRVFRQLLFGKAK